MFTTAFFVDARLSDEQKKEAAKKHWRREFGGCDDVECKILETTASITKVEVACTNEKHDHAEGLIE